MREVECLGRTGEVALMVFGPEQLRDCCGLKFNGENMGGTRIFALAFHMFY